MKAKILLMFMVTASLLLSEWTGNGPWRLPACRGEVQRTGPLETVPPIPPRPEWNRFKILIWPHQTHVMKDYPLYRRLGLGGFQIDRGAGKADQVKLSIEQKFPYYVGHTADKGWLYLSGENRKRILHRSDLMIRPCSLSDPDIISEMKTHMEKNIRATRKGFVLAYAFDDEISLGRMTSPADVDIHPKSVGWFREWLKGEYRTIDALNGQWETEYADFGQVTPHGFESIRKRLDSRRLSSWNLSPWMDFRRFMDYQFAAVLAELTRHANRLDPDIPAGFVGGQPPSPWGGYDYAMLCRSVQWMEAYDIFSTDEILRSFWGSGLRPRMQTFFSTGDVKQDAWFLWYYLVHGNRGAVAWPEKWFRVGENAVAPNLLKLRETFEAVQGEISEVILDSELRFAPIPSASIIPILPFRPDGLWTPRFTERPGPAEAPRWTMKTRRRGCFGRSGAKHWKTLDFNTISSATSISGKAAFL